MSLETWVSIGSLVVVTVGLYGALSAQNSRLRKEFGALRTELKGDLAELRTELKGDNADLRTELKGDLARLDDRVAGLDDRIYALAVGLRPRLREDDPIEQGGSTA